VGEDTLPVEEKSYHGTKINGEATGSTYPLQKPRLKIWLAGKSGRKRGRRL